MSSREDTGRYRGRRRAPSPPRARYVAVVTTAFVGAGAVALGTAHMVPDLKAEPAALAQDSSSFAADGSRAADAAHANRSTARTDVTTPDATTLGADQSIPELWMTPLKSYVISDTFGDHPDSVHPGVDLVAPGGTPYYAAHAGTVRLARYYGGYGYCVMLDLGGGVTLLYGHSAKLMVHEGQQVQAGDMIGLVGDTGFSYGAQLHFEVRVNDKTVEPMAYLLQYGVDLQHPATAG